MKRKTLRNLCCVFFIIAQICVTLSAATKTTVYRDKRTIDSVLRGVADAFGYDIQKRPSLLPPVATTVAPKASTFAPPPLQPLPPASKPAVGNRLTPRASAAPPANPPKIPFLPPLRPLPQPSSKSPPPPPPKAAPQPPPKGAPPPPPPPKAPAKPRPTPQLLETFQKTFNLNFNWNKNVNPQNPPPKQPPAAGAPAPPPPATAPKPVAPPPPPAPPARPGKPSAGGQSFIHKPQLYTEESPEHITFNDYEELPESAQLNDNYEEYQNQLLNQDYSESTKNFATEPHENEHESAKENYKNSVNEFWKHYPMAAQYGYKYITPENLKALHTPREFSKYEEYNIEPSMKKEKTCKKKVKKPVVEVKKSQDVQDYDDGYTRIYLLPRDDYINPNEHLHEDEEEKNISQAETIAHPLFSGVLPVQLHQLASSESDSKPFSIPFDYQSSGSEIKNKVVQNKNSNCCNAETSSEDFDFYTVPEPKPINYAQYEQLFTDEDDDKFSKNAKIKTNQRSVSILNSNKYETPTSW